MKENHCENNALIESIVNHPFFSSFDNTNITQLDKGLSHLCFKVVTTSASYFVKVSESKALSVKDELALLTAVSEANLSPSVFYCDKQWLITEFIEGETLFELDIPLKDKIDRAVILMADFHWLSYGQLKPLANQVKQSNASNVPLNISEIIESMINEGDFTKQQRQLFASLYASVKQDMPLNTSVDGQLFCHGDINFNNILCDKVNNKSYLIDFDCTCLAEPAFDLAMMIAVNELPVEQSKQSITTLITQYQDAIHQKKISSVGLSSETQISRVVNIVPTDEVVTRYLMFCYLINGLWYLSNNVKTGNSTYRRLAKSQFTLLNKRFTLNDFALTELINTL